MTDTKTVVIVEDDAWLAASYERLLTKRGYDVHRASHALGAIDLIDQVAPDVIMLDVLLDGTNALALLHELQSHSDLANIPVILVTNLADSVSLDDVSSYGVVALHDKSSLHPEELLTAVRRAVL